MLVPIYIYPADVDENPAYTRLIDLKRRYEKVPMSVIVNPASGPGAKADANYTRAIDQLRAAGCLPLGYVTTGYGKRPAAEVRRDIDSWLELYPRIQGILFDEMIYEDSDAGVQYQVALNRYAHDAGCQQTVGNPGAKTPDRYFAAHAADVIVVHEGNSWPREEQLKPSYVERRTHATPNARGVLLYGQPRLDRQALRIVLRHARWIYVTEAEYRPGDPMAANPWDRVSKHLQDLCECLTLQ